MDNIRPEIIKAVESMSKTLEDLDLPKYETIVIGDLTILKEIE